MLKKTEVIKRRKAIHRIIRIHMGLLSGMLVTYVVLGLFFGPTFLLSDVQKKYDALANGVTRTLTVFAEVLAPPIQPIVTANSSCPVGALSVSLAWPDDRGSFSYDVYRDGVLLVIGLLQPAYTDVSVQSNTTYSYKVVAHGPMGSGIAESDAVSVTTPIDCESLILPQIQIVTLGDNNVSLISSIQYSGALQPLITGTTNKPNATVNISLVGGQQTLHSSVTTRASGYWEWALPEAMMVDTTYQLTAIVTDPLHPGKQAMDMLTVTVPPLSQPPGDTDTGGTSHHRKSGGESGVTPTAVPRIAPKTNPQSKNPESPVLIQDMYIPIQFSLTVTNPDGQVLQNRYLTTRLAIADFEKRFNGASTDVTYHIFDPTGKEVLTASRSLTIFPGVVQEESFLVPFSWGDGVYRVRADIRTGQTLVSGETRFSVRLLPIFDFGGGITINWNGFMAFIGWTINVLLLLLFLLFFFFSREYMLYLHSTRHITELTLLRKGFFGPRKGVWP